MDTKPEKKKNNVNSMLLGITIAVFLFGMGFKLGELKTNSENSQKHLYNAFTEPTQDFNNHGIDFNLYWKVLNKIDEKYVDKKKVDPQKLLYGSIKGMVAAIGDPYTYFLPPTENKAVKDELGGKFEGIGAQLGMKDGHIVIVAALPHSPSEKAGVHSGDYITKVDGTATNDWSLVQAVSKIRGNKGTKVTLSLFREPKTQLDVTITRDQIVVDPVILTYNNDVAVIKVNQFGDNTNDGWDKAIDEVVQKWDAKSIKGVVVDLRDNPGGFLDSAVYLASEFIPEGKLVVKQQSTVNGDHEYFVTRQGRLMDIPMAVIINKGSASASEIFSGAMRDYKRGKLVGEKSFGKGSVQEAMDLEGGAGLHVTIAKWLLPKGDWINGKGIVPDVAAALDSKDGNTITPDTDSQLQAAIKLFGKN